MKVKVMVMVCGREDNGDRDDIGVSRDDECGVMARACCW